MNETLKIMYVDDEADIRTIVEFALEDEEGFALKICASGQEALSPLRKAKKRVHKRNLMIAKHRRTSNNLY